MAAAIFTRSAVRCTTCSAGNSPSRGSRRWTVIVGRITGQAVPISEVRPGLPPRLVQAIEKLMATNPDDRYQTADEAAAALRSLLRPKNVPRRALRHRP